MKPWMWKLLGAVVFFVGFALMVGPISFVLFWPTMIPAFANILAVALPVGIIAGMVTAYHGMAMMQGWPWSKRYYEEL